MTRRLIISPAAFDEIAQALVLAGYAGTDVLRFDWIDLASDGIVLVRDEAGEAKPREAAA